MSNKIKIFGASDCYGLTKELSFTLRASLGMKDAVDEGCLKEAVGLLEKRFHYLKVSLRKNWHEFYFVSNPAPWVVKNTSHPISLNGEESNNQIIAFSYEGNSIFVDAWHGQMDGTGIYALVKALLYYYCRLRYDAGINVPNVAMPDDDISPEEYVDAYKWFYSKKTPKETDAPKPQKISPHPLRLDKMGKVHVGKRSRTRLILQQSELMKYCSSADGSPVSAIALMMATAIKNVHPDSDKDVVIGIPVNLRPAMGLKVSRASTFTKVFLQYNERLKNKDYETQGTICRGTIIRYTDERLLRNYVRKYCRKLALLNKVPFTGLKRLFAQIVAKQMKEGETATVTYVGREDYGDMEQYITSFYADVDAYGLGMQVLLAGLGDKFFVSIDRDWEEKIYVDAFLDVLTERQLSYEVVYEGPNEMAVMDKVF